MWGRHIEWMDKKHPEHKDFLNDKNKTNNDYSAGGKSD
jgi:hypothetical protein